MSTIIRQAKIQDIPRIAEIIVFSKRISYRKIFKDDEVSFNQIQVLSLIQEFQSKPEMLENMFVYDDGIIKACISFIAHSQSQFEICDFYVDVFFKRQGIGKNILKYICEKSYISKNIYEIFLWVLKDNSEARLFYEAMGFIPTTETKFVPDTTVQEIKYLMKPVAFKDTKNELRV